MSVCYFVLLLTVSFSLSALAEDHEQHVHDHKLSDKDPGSPEYDHEAFLGRDEAAEFDELSPEESIRRLGKIIDKIDKDNNQQITGEELKDWLNHTQSRYIQDDADKHFEHLVNNKDKKSITWDEYKKMSYGFLDDEEAENEEHKNLMEKDMKRFKLADEDQDGSCTIEEFRAFLHPEVYDRMKDLVVQETIDELDHNKDGFVDVDEFVSDRQGEESEHSEESDWADKERKEFANFRDLDKDGKLNFAEVQEWIMPASDDYVTIEADHLLESSDDNKDGTLSKQEILDHHDLFAGSQVTNFGEDLRKHDEF